ncbi:glycerophosphodiester phosphodiesterase family protein [Eubacteriales bacterium KG127]
MREHDYKYIIKSSKYYIKSVPGTLVYQVIAKGILLAILFAANNMMSALLWTVNLEALTSGDIPYLMRDYRGWAILIVGFILISIYIIFNINMMVLLSNKIVMGKKESLIDLGKTAAKNIKKFVSLRGAAVVLYLFLIIPLNQGLLKFKLGSFAIPDFIMSYIRENEFYHMIFICIVILVNLLGIFHVFTFHFILLNGKSLKESLGKSRRLVKENFLYIIFSYLMFVMACFGSFVILLFLAFELPRLIIESMTLSEINYHFLIVFSVVVMLFTVILFTLLVIQFQYVWLTKKFFKCQGMSDNWDTPKVKGYLKYFAVSGILFLMISASSSYFMAENFSTLFPKVAYGKTIAHRGGGVLEAENTIDGLNAAIANKIYGAEIDVQRTLDGRYIINHDDDFYRMCGDKRKPQDVTLDQVKSMNISKANGFTSKIATIEEMLDAAKGKIHLYIELKGKTADRKMADDLYQIVKSKDMLNECTFISLDYKEIDYMERKHKDANTMYLCFFALGGIENLNVDGVALEIEVASPSNIERLRSRDKSVAVWTCNSAAALGKSITSSVDYVVTDEVLLANAFNERIKKEPDYIRVLNTLIYLIR